MSIDSADPDELLRGGKAGADFLLSLNEDTLHIADEVASIPVLIPKDHGDMASLYRAMDALDAKGRAISRRPRARSDQFRLHGSRSSAMRSSAASGPTSRS